MEQIISSLKESAAIQKQIIAGNAKMIQQNENMLETMQEAIRKEKENQKKLKEAFAALGL